jgi:tryptophanyl-tRNA synthetase
VPSLLGEGKMSKSVEGSYIALTDNLETIKERLAKVPTDSGKGDAIPQKSGVASLLNLVELYQGIEKKKEYEEMYKNDGLRYKDLKEELALAIYSELKPMQEKRQVFENDEARVDTLLQEGAEKARSIASATMKEVKKAMGLFVYN